MDHAFLYNIMGIWVVNFFSGVEEKKNRNAILSRYDSFEYISLFGTFFINTRDIGR